MNDDELLERLGRELRDDDARARSDAEKALEGSLDEAFENRLFDELGVADAKTEPPRNLIPFPPNRAKKTSTIAGGVAMVFAAAAAFVLMQRGPSASLGAYELSATSERLERSAALAPDETIHASTGRPLTLVLRPTTAATSAPEVHVRAVLGGTRHEWPARVETAASGALRVVVTPDHAGAGELSVILTAKGASVESEPRLVMSKPIDVRAQP
jgi:hypothetical protein